MASAIRNYMDLTNLAASLCEEAGASFAVELGQASAMNVYARLICAAQHSLFFLGRREGKK